MYPRFILSCFAGLFAFAASSAWASEGTEWGNSGDL